MLDQMPLVHNNIKRLRWERTLNTETDNLTLQVL
jgi:hypothetical protein